MERAAIDITGEGRVWCRQCLLISPAFYPNCPFCETTVFGAMQTQPHPPIRCDEELYTTISAATPFTVVEERIALYRALEMVCSLATKGFFLVANRTIIAEVWSYFNFSVNLCNFVLAVAAREGNIVYLDPGSNIRRAFMLAPVDNPNIPNFLQVISTQLYPPHMTPDVIAAPGPDYGDIRSVTETLFAPERMPDPGSLVYCSLCFNGNHDPADVTLGIDDSHINAIPIDAAAGDLASYMSFRVLPCGHMYHPTCITRWFHVRFTCPQCRRPVFTGDLDFDAWLAMLS